MLATNPTVSIDPSESEGRKKGISRSIIIGLGGTGHDIVLDVRRRLIEKYGRLDRIPIVAFAVFDADAGIKGSKPVSDDPVLDKAINLDPADKIHTSVRGMDSLRRELASYPHLKSWLDPTALSGDVELGAGAVRARGRLAFFWNYNDLARKIEEKHNQVKLDESVRHTIANGLTVGDGVTVYLVGSLMGGTGSGMFLDAAYTVRERLPDAQVIGIFTVPPASGAVAVDNRANTYAALLELNHWSDNSSVFTAQYARDRQPLSEVVGSKPPFTYCYLVDKEGPQTNIEISALTSMIGNSIFLDLTSEFQRQKKSNRDNYSAFLSETDGLGCPQSFVSFGLSSLYFPKDKVRLACANRLAKTIVREWMTPLDRSTNIPAFAGQEMLKLGLERAKVKFDLLFWEDGGGDGTIKDAIQAQWNHLSQDYAVNYPGHGAVASTFLAQDNLLNEMLRDNDPNPDVLQKLRPNVGEYTRGMQTNLQGHIPAKKAALSAWVAHTVNTPAHRHTVARDVLLQWQELIDREVRDLKSEVKQTREMTQGDADRKSALTQRINDYAGDFSLAIVPGAKKKAIDEGKDDFLSNARASHANQVDERVSEFTLKFYDEMRRHIDTLLAELDGYIARVKGLRDYFAQMENQAITLEPNINGEVLFNAGTRRKDEEGQDVFEGGDIDFYFAREAGNPEVVNKTQTDIRHILGLDDTIYALKDADARRVRAQMLARCETVFAPLDNESVLERFYRRYKDSPVDAENQFKRVWNAAQPFIKINENDANWALKEQLKCRPTVVGLMHGNDPQTEPEADFVGLMEDQIAGLDAQNIANNAEQHQVLFIRERAGFPLRLLHGLDNYKFVYDQERARGGANPIHTRADIAQWIRIHPPSRTEQWRAWETFVAGWSSGVIQEIKSVQNTVLGAIETTSYRISYTDSFGFPKTDELGQWRETNQHNIAHAVFGGAKREDTTRPPLEALNIVLTLCDKKTLHEQIRNAIELRRKQVGDVAFARAILDHARKQQHLPFYETYYQTLVGDPNAAPPRTGFLENAGLAGALQNIASETGASATISEVSVLTPAINGGVPTGQSNGNGNAPIPLGPSHLASPPALSSPGAPTPMPSPATQWYYAINNSQRGPIGDAMVRELVAIGAIDAQTKVWRDGMSAWTPAGSTELSALFGATPSGPAMPPPL
jgi:hypothetical protein